MLLEHVGDTNLRRTRFHNPPPRDLPAGAPKDALRQEFARRLHRALIDKGFDQSELARRASDHMPQKEEIGRSLISAYIRGRAVPSPVRLRAMSKVLGVEPDELLPHAMAPSVERDDPPFGMTQLEDGNVWLKVNRPVTMKQALKIMSIIEEEDSAPQ